MKKILQITVRADYGGGPEHIYQLEKNIDKSFIIYTASPNQEPYFEKFKELSQSVIEIPKQTFSIFHLFKILKFIKKNEIKIVHSHGRGAGIYSRLLKLFSPNLKIVHTLHGIHYDEKLDKKNLGLIIERVLNKFTRKIICVSKEELQKGKKLKLIKDNYTIIENGIDVEMYKELLELKSELNQKYRKKYKINRDDLVIGNISRFSSEKGLGYLLKAFSKLEIKNKKLVIIGDGEEREKILLLIKEFKIEKDVILVGATKNVPEIIQIFDIYVTTSLREGLPISLLEVMASKIPIVATNVVGNNSLIIDGETGILCEAKNSESSQKGIEKILKENKKYIYNAYDEINKKYNVDIMIKKIENTYIKILKMDKG